MKTMDENLNRWLFGEDAIIQAVKRTIRTRIGSQVVNRIFGSRAHDSIDRSEPEVRAHLSQSLFMALSEFVPSFQPVTVEYDQKLSGTGELNVMITGYIKNKEVQISEKIRY